MTTDQMIIALTAGKHEFPCLNQRAQQNFQSTLKGCTRCNILCGSVRFRLCKVQYLDLSMSETSTTALEQVVSACVMLRKLSLANCVINENVCRYLF